VEILVAIYDRFLSLTSPQAPERDRFILSKGHAALALYSTLYLKGVLSAEQLNSFLEPGTLLGVHPERQIPGIDFTTGSLGHGLSMGAGAALAARLQESQRRVVALLSDGECNEGSVWEAMMFAAQHRLANLTAIVDANGQQAFGRTRDVLNTEPLGDRWKLFGWDVQEVDGHDLDQLTNALQREGERPKAIVARTVFGKGVSYMEGQIAWNYLPMTEVQYRQALQEVG
jgi:transketolase